LPLRCVPRVDPDMHVGKNNTALPDTAPLNDIFLLGCVGLQVTSAFMFDLITLEPLDLLHTQLLLFSLGWWIDLGPHTRSPSRPPSSTKGQCWLLFKKHT
jgi:hypothetical protein